MAAREAGEGDPIPIGLYLDGVAFRTPAAGKQDSCLGLWMINLITSKRVLLSITLSSDSCACGCRGWCSLYPHLHCAAWQLESLAIGRRPLTQHDGSPWPKSSVFKNKREYKHKCALIWIKGDSEGCTPEITNTPHRSPHSARIVDVPSCSRCPPQAKHNISICDL